MKHGIGTVKWFGGYNNKTGKDNDYGFVEDVSGQDFFLHKSEWQEEAAPSEGLLVTYSILESKGRWSASSASPVEYSTFTELATIADEYWGILNRVERKLVSQGLTRSLRAMGMQEASDYLEQLDDQQLKKVINILIGSGSSWDVVCKIEEQTGLNILDVCDWSCFSRKLVLHKSADIVARINCESDERAKELIGSVKSKATLDMLAYWVLTGSMNLPLESASTQSRFDNFLHGLGDSTLHYPDYLTGLFAKEVNLAKACIAKLLKIIGINRILKPFGNEFSEIMPLVKGVMKEEGQVFLLEVDWELFDSDYIAQNAEEFAQAVRAEGGELSENVEAISSRAPNDLLMFLGLAGYTSIADRNRVALTQYIQGVYLKKYEFPEYLKSYVDEEIKPKGGLMSAPVIGDIFVYSQFLAYLFQKDIKFISLFEQSSYLQTRLDAFVLKELFALLMSDNAYDDVYRIFLGKLWQAISACHLDLSNQIDQILSLFPSCGTLSIQSTFLDGGLRRENFSLSCEAVYWRKQDAYLCRGRSCLNPKINGGQATEYFGYSIYDWFAHYDISYMEAGKPSARDFPIKLAGFFNRLREIWSVLHCRDCQSLMLPELKYARVEHTVFEQGQFVKKDMAPAYRLTVFKCPNISCIDHGVGHYINHCMGFDCYSLIDDRDCQARCDTGRYICKGCGSCCSDHAKTNPVGLCPQCGDGLVLYETDEREPYSNRVKRVVRCQAGCGFEIGSDKLSKKFYQESCGPVFSLDSGRDLP
ncbi:cold-shock protein [Bacterioplanoides sp. SCSIO 12839]|uniref:cold-shock protein n=1 Tax=Bacterioplanoides sp. SCSIO 12839 TaxID=2829569 RepID=UPI0021036F06|nr:cold shock domain-containing protein [Bacterioplanoides sp. SCSIO 12839]UTW49804.1 cold shock domain-containing protein [Bacterioplanoides sp. SCSIO 12839]